MLETRDNPSSWWVITLCISMASVHFISAPLFAQADDPRLHRPAAPSGPDAGEIVAPAVPHAPVESPSVPRSMSAGKAVATSQEMDERMRDLAKRMAEVESAGVRRDGARTAAKEAPLTEDQRDLAEKQALTSNQQRIADPADARPLGARRQSADNSAPVTAPSTSSSALTVLMALGVVIGLIFLLRAGMRKLLGTSAAVSGSSVVQVLTRVAVAPRNHVVLLRVAGRILVVSDCPSGMRTLAQIESAEEVADILTAVSSAKTTSSTAGFRQVLGSLSAGYESEPAPAEAGGDENEFRIDRARDNVSGLLGKLRNLTGKGGAA